jgi:hypothetical protein
LRIRWRIVTLGYVPVRDRFVEEITNARRRVQLVRHLGELRSAGRNFGKA